MALRACRRKQAHACGAFQQFAAALLKALGAIGLLGILAAALPWLATLQTKEESEETYLARREAMVREQIEGRGIKDKAVLAAFRKVPRHRFVPAVSRHLAYADRPLADRRRADDLAAGNRRLDDRADQTG